MTLNDSQEKAQTAIKKLFDHLKVERIVCVDDEYILQVPYEVIVGFCAEADQDALNTITELDSIAFDENEAIWKTQLKRFWDTQEDSAKKHIFHQLKAIINKDEEREDIKAANVLSELLVGFEFQQLPPDKWDKEKLNLLKEAEFKKTLFLFDQNLSNAGRSSTAGISLIQDALASTSAKEIICGLFSHTFEPEQEHELWKELAHENNIDLGKFVLISKRRLQNDPIGFARMIKLTSLNPECKTLKEKASEVIHKAHEEAQRKVEEINIYDFEHIVFQSSNREGIWEPDTLFRIFGLYHRVEARKEAKKDADLHNLAARIRDVSLISTNSDEAPKHSSWKIQHLELYEDANHLNNYHLPIELGDIFEKTSPDTQKKYILLAQPCDLMVRLDNGINKPGRHPSVSETILAEIIEQDTEKTDLEGYFELPYFQHGNNKNCYVSFRKRCTVNLSILDLCVYQEDGTATFKLSEPCPSDVIPTWKLYHGEIHKKLEKAITEYDKWSKKNNLPKDILDKIIPQASLTGLFKGKIELPEKSISYDFKRVGRLYQPHAAAMLTKFANYLARAAFEVDLGRED